MDNRIHILEPINFSEIVNYTNKVKLEYHVQMFRTVSSNYVIPFMGVFGAVNNFIGLLAIQKIKQRNYGYLKAKYFTEMFMCLLMIGFQDFTCTYCQSFRINNIYILIYRLYFFLIQTKTLYLVSNICDTGIAYSRFCFINDIQNSLNKSKVCVYLFAMFTSILLNLPDYFAYKITHDKNDQYILSMTYFGTGLFYYVFFISRIVIHNGISIILVLIFNTRVIIKFINFRYYIMRTDTENERDSKILTRLKNQNGLPQMVSVFSTIFLIGRVANIIDAVWMHHDPTVNVLLRTCLLLLNIFLFSFHPIIVLMFDRYVRNKLRDMIVNYLTVKPPI